MPVMEPQQFSLARAKIYGFLSRVFHREMDEELLKSMKIQGYPAIEDSELQEAYQGLRIWLSEHPIDKRLTEDLAADYGSLFLGFGRHPAHPYESVYTTEDGIVMGEPRNQVVAFYERLGLRRLASFPEPDDHIALELAFMAFLCLEEENASRGGKAKEAEEFLVLQRTFLDDHLSLWVPRFCDTILTASCKHDFYRYIAHLSRRFVLIERDTLAGLIETS